MVLSKSKPITLPILPLAKDSVLLPGLTLRVPVLNRPDVPALLSAAYSRAATPEPDATTISIGCVPLNSALLGPDGQNLLDDVEAGARVQIDDDIHPGKATKEDLFSYGSVAKISGVQGRRTELALIVEGIRRFKVNRIVRDKPYFEADITYLEDDGTQTSQKSWQSYLVTYTNHS